MRSFRANPIIIDQAPLFQTGYVEVAWRDIVTDRPVFVTRKLRRKRSLAEMQGKLAIRLDPNDPTTFVQSCAMWQARFSERVGWAEIWVLGVHPMMAMRVGHAMQTLCGASDLGRDVWSLIERYYDPRLSGDLFEHAYRFVVCGCDHCYAEHGKVKPSNRLTRQTRLPRDRILWAN